MKKAILVMLIPVALVGFAAATIFLLLRVGFCLAIEFWDF